MANNTDRERVEEIAKIYTSIVKSEINIVAAYLYGSYAKGNYTDDSDIDIAIVGDGFTGDNIDDTMKLMRLRRKVDNRIEPHPFKSDEFDISNPFVKEIITTGIRII